MGAMLSCQVPKLRKTCKKCGVGPCFVDAWVVESCSSISPTKEPKRLTISRNCFQRQVKLNSCCYGTEKYYTVSQIEISDFGGLMF